MPRVIDIHYTWIGPPHAGNHDVEGPIPMAAALANTVDPTYKLCFWCLDRYTSDFRAKLAGTPFTVRGIEAFLATCRGTLYRWVYWYGAREDDVVRRVQRILDLSVPAPGAPWTGTRLPRNLVNAKNAWAYFLLYTWGGYHFDTGVLPSGHPLRLREFPTLMAPGDAALGTFCDHRQLFPAPDHQMCGAVNAEGAHFYGGASEYKVPVPLLDVWALYSPRYHFRSWLALSWYCRAWERVQGVLNDDDYKQACRAGVMNALYTSLMHDAEGQDADFDADAAWDFITSASGGPVIARLGIAKIHHGSHR